MRKFLAIATLIIVAGFSFSYVAYASGSYFNFTNTFGYSDFQWNFDDVGGFIPHSGTVYGCQYKDGLLMNYSNGLIGVGTESVLGWTHFNIDNNYGFLGGWFDSAVSPHTNGVYPSGIYSFVQFNDYVGLSCSTHQTDMEASAHYVATYSFNWNGSSGVNYEFGSHFISFVPGDSSIVASTTVNATSTFYVSSSDYDLDARYIIVLYYYDATGKVIPIWQTAHGSDSPKAVPGLNYFSTSTLNLSRNGTYKWVASICRTTGFWVFATCDDTIVSSSTVFYVGSSTIPYTSGITALDQKFQSLFSSTTANLGSDCNPLSGFDISNCLLAVLYPGKDIIYEDFLLLRTMPPWGYIYRVYDLLATTTGASIPIIDAVVPPGIPGTGAHLVLDMNHSLDYLLNATSSIYSSGSATSSKTLYEITSPYWTAIVYLLLSFYIIRRIIVLRH